MKILKTLGIVILAIVFIVGFITLLFSKPYISLGIIAGLFIIYIFISLYKFIYDSLD